MEEKDYVMEEKKPEIDTSDNIMKEETVGKAETSEAKVADNNEKTKKKGKKIAIIVIIAVAALVLILGVIIIIAVLIGSIALKPKTVDLGQYVEIYSDGYDGFGRATVAFNKDAFVEDNSGKIYYTNKLVRAIEKGKEDGLEALFYEYGYDYDSFDDEAPAGFIADVLEDNITLSSSENLSNNEEVTLSWNLDEFYAYFNNEEAEKYVAKYFHVKLNGEDIDETIDNLITVPKFDPFEGVELSFSGISPAGQVFITNFPDNDIHYHFEDGMYGVDEVKNGDQVKVIADCGDMESYIQRNNQAPSVTEKVYEVEGLPEVITSFSDIPQSIIDKLKQQTEDVILSSDGKSSSSYVGSYFLTAKNTDLEKMNQLVLVYKVHSDMKISGLFEKEEYDYSLDYYYSLTWSNFCFENDMVNYNTQYEKPDKFRKDTGFELVPDLPITVDRNGYETMEDAYRKIVTSNLEYYTVEENIAE